MREAHSELGTVISHLETSPETQEAAAAWLKARERPQKKAATITTPAAFRRTRTGHLVHWRGAADVEITDRPDPTVTDRVQLVRGARRRNTLRDVFHRGVITTTQFDAAERFLDDHAAANNSGSLIANLTAVRSNGGSNMTVSDRQLGAIKRVRSVVELLHLDQPNIFSWIVIENQTLGGYDSFNHKTNGTASIKLKEVLDTLADYYDRRTPRSRAAA